MFLTEVVGRKLYVTDFGKEIVNQIHSINYKTLAYQGQVTGRLKISAVSTGKYVIPYFLSGFIRQHPGIELVMDVTNKEKVIESLENNEVDFPLVSILPSALNIERMDLLQNKLYLVGNSQNSEQTITLEDFESIPLIFREKGSGTRTTMEGFIKHKNISVLKKMELTSNEAVKQALLAGLGYSIMPLIGIRNELYNQELKIIPIKGLPIKTMWSLIWMRGKKHSPVSELYLQYLQKAKAEIIEKRFSWCEQY